MPAKKTSKSCFVIAPIGKPDSETRRRSDHVFEHIIKPVTKALGYSVLRADHMPEPGLITRQVISAVVDADLVVADLSEHNPNVFYELSLRHALGRPVVHIIREGEEPPFDNKDVRAVPYSSEGWTLDATKRALRSHIRSIQKQDYVQVSPISVTVDLEALSQVASREGAAYDLPLRFVVDELTFLRRALARLERAVSSVFPVSAGLDAEVYEPEEVAMEILARLPPQQRKIMELKYGLEDGQPRTFDQVAREFNVAPETINRLHDIALAQLKSAGLIDRLLPAMQKSNSFPDSLMRLIMVMVTPGSRI